MTSGILTCLGFYLLLRSWSGIETVAGTDKKIAEKRGVFLGGWVSQHVSHDRDVIVAVFLISKTRTAVRGKIWLSMTFTSNGKRQN